MTLDPSTVAVLGGILAQTAVVVRYLLAIERRLTRLETLTPRAAPCPADPS